jgi:ABC-type branched-subunit amino acid transport system substrate-binding protein
VKNRILFISLAVVLALSVSLVGCGGPIPPTAPDSIKILAVRSLSGPLKQFEDTAMGPIYKYWRNVVNNVSGGIYVPEFDKKIPVEIDVKDDTSDMATMTTLLETNLATGDYNFVIGPCCTAFLEAAGPICSLYGAILVGAEGGATALAQEMNKYPYMFSNLSFANWNQAHELCRLMNAWAAKETDGKVDVYIMYLNDQHGYEYRDSFVAEAAGYTTIHILKEVGMPPFTEEVTAQVDEATSMGADVLCIFAYPPTPFAVIGYAAATGQNFKGIVTGPCACYEGFYSLWGFHDTAEGICGFGAWNEYSSTALGEFAAGMIAYSGRDIMDWWGGAYYYVGLDMLAKAIAAADEYTAVSVRNVMASQKLTTILGETYYTTYDGTFPIGASGGLLAMASHPGEVGQWQHVTAANGWRPDGVTTGPARAKPAGIPADATEWMIFEVITFDHPTAAYIYPKPNWPGT